MRTTFSMLLMMLALSLSSPTAAQEDSAGAQFRGQMPVSTSPTPAAPLPHVVSKPPAQKTTATKTSTPSPRIKAKATSAKTKPSQSTAKPAHKTSYPKVLKKTSTTSRPAANTAPAPLHIQAKAAYLMDMKSGVVYFSQNADHLIPPLQ